MPLTLINDASFVLMDYIVISLAALELDNFAKILEAEGVKVRRPEVCQGDFSQGYETPDFKVIP